MTEEEYITTPELCDWLKVAKSTVSRWRSQGLPYVGKERAYRYQKSEVLIWSNAKAKAAK